MLKKIILSSVLVSIFSFSSLAQSESFQFIEDKHDFGMVEEGINALWEFKFKNVGTDTITLQQSDVRASCGCTTPSWTKEAIPPGGMGSVSAQFNSAGRPGVFNKNVTVSYKGGVVKMLTIKGVVIKPDTAKVTEAEKKKSPIFWAEKTSHHFGKVERGQKVVTRITVKNNGKDSLEIINAQAACSCITYKLMMEKKDKTTYEVKNVPPGKTAFLEFVYYPTGDGLNTDVITFQTNDKTQRRKALSMTAEVVNSLQEKSPVMEDKSNVPFGK
ncbi:MAG: DUF1573 domain-containing protein [Cytophagaceae bacterium]|jgi:hypothetical protein|nr:DUF1573 domain-containing protein [Cytophagaceae bacterium]